MARIILVNASPRRGGNSEAAVRHLEAALLQRLGEESSLQVVSLREQPVGYCLACDACQGREDQRCVQDDGMARLLPDLEAADALVLVSPVYNQMLCAQAVAFIDRLYPFFKADDPMWSNSRRKGKRAAVVAVSWGSSPAYERLAAEAAAGLCQMGASDTRGLALGGINGRGEINARPDHLARLDELADWLAS